MAKTYVLDRVAADLARGFTHPAIQRLSSLVAAYPNDLDLRRRLAAVHRRAGNRIQAGRWDYLTIGADSGDTHAFERAFPSPVARLREVRWPQRAGQAATAYARQRLTKLMTAAAAERPRRFEPTAGGTAEPTPRGTSGIAALRDAVADWWPFGRSRSSAIVTAAVAALVTAPLVVVGLVTVLQWII
jgi:hypothetical protein